MTKMTTYTPDRWVLLKITTPAEVLYKVLASWYGGYAGSDSWKLSSGTVSLKEDAHVLELLQYSGSSYICYKNSYGMSSYARSILANWQSTLDPKLGKLKYSQKILILRHLPLSDIIVAMARYSVWAD